MYKCVKHHCSGLNTGMTNDLDGVLLLYDGNRTCIVNNKIFFSIFFLTARRKQISVFSFFLICFFLLLYTYRCVIIIRLYGYESSAWCIYRTHISRPIATTVSATTVLFKAIRVGWRAMENCAGKPVAPFWIIATGCRLFVYVVHTVFFHFILLLFFIRYEF